MRAIAVVFQVMLVVGGNARKRGECQADPRFVYCDMFHSWPTIINPDINIYNWLGWSLVSRIRHNEWFIMNRVFQIHDGNVNTLVFHMGLLPLYGSLSEPPTIKWNGAGAPLESHESYSINGHFHNENQIIHHKYHFHNRNDLSDECYKMTNKPRWTGLIWTLSLIWFSYQKPFTDY